MSVIPDPQVEALIEAVRKRPTLLQLYWNIEKQQLWRDVAIEVCGTGFFNWELKYQEDAVKKLKSTWWSLRICFETEIRKKPNERRPHMYFDNLQFLIEELKRKGEKIEEETNLYARHYGSRHQIVSERQEEVLQNSMPMQNEVAQDSIPMQEKVAQKTKPQNLEESGPPEKRQKIVKTTRPKNSKIDSTNFALSLVPMLNMLPIDKRIDAQVSILGELKKFCTEENGVVESDSEENGVEQSGSGGESTKQPEDQANQKPNEHKDVIVDGMIMIDLTGIKNEYAEIDALTSMWDEDEIEDDVWF